VTAFEIIDAIKATAARERFLCGKIADCLLNDKAQHLFPHRAILFRVKARASPSAKWKSSVSLPKDITTKKCRPALPERSHRDYTPQKHHGQTAGEQHGRTRDVCHPQQHLDPKQYLFS